MKRFENKVFCQDSQKSQPGIIDYKNFKRGDVMKNKLNTFQTILFISNSIVIDFLMCLKYHFYCPRGKN
jgi:hypothetical protein